MDKEYKPLLLLDQKLEQVQDGKLQALPYRLRFYIEERLNYVKKRNTYEAQLINHILNGDTKPDAFIYSLLETGSGKEFHDALEAIKEELTAVKVSKGCIAPEPKKTTDEVKAPELNVVITAINEHDNYFNTKVKDCSLITQAELKHHLPHTYSEHKTMSEYRQALLLQWRTTLQEECAHIFTAATPQAFLTLLSQKNIQYKGLDAWKNNLNFHPTTDLLVLKELMKQSPTYSSSSLSPSLLFKALIEVKKRQIIKEDQEKLMQFYRTTIIKFDRFWNSTDDLPLLLDSCPQRGKSLVDAVTFATQGVKRLQGWCKTFEPFCPDRDKVPKISVYDKRKNTVISSLLQSSEQPLGAFLLWVNKQYKPQLPHDKKLELVQDDVLEQNLKNKLEELPCRLQSGIKERLDYVEKRNTYEVKLINHILNGDAEPEELTYSELEQQSGKEFRDALTSFNKELQKLKIEEIDQIFNNLGDFKHFKSCTLTQKSMLTKWGDQSLEEYSNYKNLKRKEKEQKYPIFPYVRQYMQGASSLPSDTTDPKTIDWITSLNNGSTVIVPAVIFKGPANQLLLNHVINVELKNEITTAFWKQSSQINKLRRDIATILYPTAWRKKIFIKKEADLCTDLIEQEQGIWVKTWLSQVKSSNNYGLKPQWYQRHGWFLLGFETVAVVGVVCFCVPQLAALVQGLSMVLGLGPLSAISSAILLSACFCVAWCVLRTIDYLAFRMGSYASDIKEPRGNSLVYRAVGKPVLERAGLVQPAEVNVSFSFDLEEENSALQPPQ